MNMPNEAQRAYIYRIALAVLAILVARGFIADGEAPMWAEIIGSVLAIGSTGLAVANTSTR